MGALDSKARLKELYLPPSQDFVLVDVPEHILRARLRGRWERLGLSEAEIAAKLEENDLPNGRLVRDGSIRPDWRILNG